MKLRALCLTVGLQAGTLAGCYVVPTGVDGNYAIYIPSHPGPLAPAQPPSTQPSQPAAPRVLHARLYPENEVATQTGMVSGT